jgi:hypothetical protein
MRNPNMPPTPAPKPDEDLSIDIEFEEEAPHPKGDPAMRGAKVDLGGQGLSRVESKTSIEFRQALAGGQEAGPKPWDEVARRFFEDHKFLKTRFEKDPAVMSGFMSELAAMIGASALKYAYIEKGSDPIPLDELYADRRFQKDLLTLSMKWEQELDARKAGKRAA